MGASISASVGVVSWVMRGGAIFASVMSAGPLWWSIDPSRSTNRTAANDEESEAEDAEQSEDGSVETIFDNV